MPLQNGICLNLETRLWEWSSIKFRELSHDDYSDSVPHCLAIVLDSRSNKFSGNSPQLSTLNTWYKRPFFFNGNQFEDTIPTSTSLLNQSFFYLQELLLPNRIPQVGSVERKRRPYHCLKEIGCFRKPLSKESSLISKIYYLKKGERTEIKEEPLIIVYKYEKVRRIKITEKYTV